MDRDALIRSRVEYVMKTGQPLRDDTDKHRHRMMVIGLSLHVLLLPPFIVSCLMIFRFFFPAHS